MPRLSPNVKTRFYNFIPPMGKVDDALLNTNVKIQCNNGTISDITLSDYLHNAKGISNLPAADGLIYNEYLEDEVSNNVFRSLATRYIPAGSSFSTTQPGIYVTSTSDNKYFRLVAFEDKSNSMSKEAIIQAIHANDHGFTIRGEVDRVECLNAITIFVFKDNQSVVLKAGSAITNLIISTTDGSSVSKIYNPSSQFLFWEMVDRTVPDSDIMSFVSNTIDVNGRLNTLENKSKDILDATTNIYNRTDSIMYQLDSLRTTVNFLATKLSEQKTQISALQSSVTTNYSHLMTSVEHIDLEQGSNDIKMEDISRNVQGISSTLSQLIILPSKVDESLHKEGDIIKSLDSIKILLEPDEGGNVDIDIKKDCSRTLTTISIASLLIQLFGLISRKRRIDE